MQRGSLQSSVGTQQAPPADFAAALLAEAVAGVANVAQKAIVTAATKAIGGVKRVMVYLQMGRSESIASTAINMTYLD